MIGRVDESSGGVLRVWRNHQGASICDRQGGGIIRERLCVIGRVEESSGGVYIYDREGGRIIRGASVIGRVEESSGSVCV